MDPTQIVRRIRDLAHAMERGDAVDPGEVEALVLAIEQADAEALGACSDALGEALVALHRAAARVGEA